jgi:Zn-dependent protease with chaperone function
MLWEFLSGCRLTGARFAWWTSVLFVGVAAQFGFGQPVGPPAATKSDPLFSGQVRIPPGKQYITTLTSPAKYAFAKIAGNVQASGGAGNDIRVLVIKDQTILFDSGRRRSVVVSADCSEPGRYSLVIDNSFSLLSPKVVYGSISIVHSGMDATKMEALRQADLAYVQRATGTLNRLYHYLKADERAWATSQMTAVSAIRVRADLSINADASWASNTINVNRGVFQFADSVGEKGADVVAAILSHEMSHIFYRHPGYGASGQGAKGLFDELQGVTALDRLQEREADTLGIRVACQAGYDPGGMLLLMAKFAEMNPQARDFMQNHPSAIARYRYLQTEAANCLASRQKSGSQGIGDLSATGTITQQATEVFDEISHVWWMRSKTLSSVYAYAFLHEQDGLLSKVLTLRPDFNLSDVGTSLPGLSARLPDGRRFLIISGCRPHFCDTYSAVIGVATDSPFDAFLYESGTEGQHRVFGRDDHAVQALLKYVADSRSRIDTLIGAN